MYPPKFDYQRADSVDDAISKMKEAGYAKFLAGGHSLIPAMNLRLADPSMLIDIGNLDGLKGISKSHDTVKIGALTTHAMVAASDVVPEALSEAAGKIGDPQVRNRGTVGGNVAHADPASDLPTVLLALKAEFHLQGADELRVVEADEFFLDLFTTALEEDEVLTAVAVPAESANTGSAYVKLFNPASRYAMVGVAAQVTVEDGKISSASVAAGGLTVKATRLPSVEAALLGQSVDDAAKEAHKDISLDDVMGDIHASAEYRYKMLPVFVKRAVQTAVERAQ